MYSKFAKVQIGNRINRFGLQLNPTFLFHILMPIFNLHFYFQRITWNPKPDDMSLCLLKGKLEVSNT